MTHPAIQPAGPVDAARVGLSAEPESSPPSAQSLTCKHCGREVVLTCWGPGHTVAFARKSDADRHRATPKHSPSPLSGSSPSGPLSEAEASHAGSGTGSSAPGRA
jgi:hypothetical protein